MKNISVQAERAYQVRVDCDWRSELVTVAHGRSRIAVIHTQGMTDRVRIDKDIAGELFYFAIADGEEAKSVESMSHLWNSLGAAGFTRSDLIVGIGGGAVTDAAGFAAAAWLRGIDWVAVPTTVAGMVDASIGGKTGINSLYGKNLIGAFHSPNAVLIDMTWLHSLSDRDFAAGMAEVIKCGFIADKRVLDLLQGQSLSALRADQERVTALIEAAVEIKARVVSSDFKESYAREVLNYGHTLGHAIEMHSGYTLRHGEAISIGLVFAAELSQINGSLTSEIVELHRELLTSLGLPITYPRAMWSELLPLLALDKKSRGTTIRFVAISAVGETLRIEGATQAQLQLAYERISS